MNYLLAQAWCENGHYYPVAVGYPLRQCGCGGVVQVAYDGPYEWYLASIIPSNTLQYRLCVERGTGDDLRSL